jgi:hypothetical protein
MRRLALGTLLTALACEPGAHPDEDGAGGPGEAPLFADRLWDDGQAEIARYRVLERRYGALREAEATLIVVKETLDADALVKADGPTPPARAIDVMKLNHVLTVPTGVYTYRQMASVFLTRDEALALKLVVGSQEWCGITHKRLVVRDGRAVLHASSYFGAEGERAYAVPMDEETVLYDALPMWARTLALSRRGPRRVRLVSQQLSNTAPRPMVAPATITVGAPERVEVPMGALEVVPVKVEHAGGTDVLFLRREAPHALVRWDRADGGRYELEWIRRAPYWELHDPEHLGLFDGVADDPPAEAQP